MANPDVPTGGNPKPDAYAGETFAGDRVLHGYAPANDQDDDDPRPSVGQTVSAVVEEGTRSIRAELSLLRAVIAFITDSTVHAAVWLSAAAMLSFVGIFAIAVIAILALNIVMPLLGAVGIVAGVLIVSAVVCVLIGRSKIRAVKSALTELG